MRAGLANHSMTLSRGRDIKHELDRTGVPVSRSPHAAPRSEPRADGGDAGSPSEWTRCWRADVITHEQNEYLCRTGPGTPMGELYRRYWIPALMRQELPRPNCPPVQV